MEYVKNISEIAGFNTRLDKLRIPSTKRQCIVGTRDTIINSKRHQEFDNKLNSFILSRCELKDAKLDLMKTFKVRSEVERVRNCTQLDKSLISRIVKQIVMLMLEDQNYLNKENGETWNAGKCLYLKDIPKYLSPEDLQSLKQECGGLKTLMKNHRYIFDVQKDSVSLRAPLEFSSDTLKYKDKPCWFLNNHPDGCLYSSENCAYRHV